MNDNCLSAGSMSAGLSSVWESQVNVHLPLNQCLQIANLNLPHLTLG